MKSLFDTKISYYRNIRDNVGTEISLRDFLFCDQYKEQIGHIRSISDEAVQKRLKLQLPMATISGTFAPTCKAGNLVAHSNLLCIDIDKKDNKDVDWFNDLKYEWHSIPQILYAGRSIRGKGWFAIFRIAYSDKHEAQFEALKRDFANCGLIIDKACKNVNRMRFITYDPEPYVNEDATLYTKVWVEPKPIVRTTYSYDCSNGIRHAEQCCQEIERRGIDITADYNDWFHVGAALASLGERGRSLFHLVSSQNAKYKASETDEKFDNLLHNVKKINIGTFLAQPTTPVERGCTDANPKPLLNDT